MFTLVCARAQTDSGYVVSSAWSSLIQPNGSLFSQRNGQPHSQFPTDTKTNMFRYSGSWMLGLVDNAIYANLNVDVKKPQVWPGPIDTVTNLPKDAIDWANVWEITRQEVEYHILHHHEKDYVLPNNIKDWPARHSDNNVNAYLAPFIDWDGNGVYEPEYGDYPSFLGDQAAYFIANDLYGENIFSNANKLGVELQGLIYSFNAEPVANTLFVKLFLINRSDNDYKPFYYGQYVDFQLGNRNDNYISTHVGENLLYGYNGDANDEGDNGYGTSLPAGGCVFLSQKMHSSCGFQMADTNRNLPTSELEMQYVMEGKWRTNLAKYAGGNGVKEVSGKETRFIYPKETEISVASENWRDEVSDDTPGARNGVGVMRFASFQAKSFKQIDLAFVVSQSEQNVESQLFDKVRNARNYFHKNLTVDDLYPEKVLDVYPNPIDVSVGNELNINALKASLFTTTGVELCKLERVTSSEKKFKMPCSEKLQSGVYYIKAVTENGLLSKKVIVVAN